MCVVKVSAISEGNKSLITLLPLWVNKQVSKSRNFGVYIVQALKELYLKVIFGLKLCLWDMALLQFQLYTCNFLLLMFSNWVNFLFGALFLYTGEINVIK